MKVPDPPKDLTNGFNTTDTNIQFEWSPGESDGGADITEYTVFYDISGFDRYRTLEEIDNFQNIFETKDLFPLIGLNQISFKVSAKNEVGLSQQSEPIHYEKKLNEETGETSFIVRESEVKDDDPDNPVDSQETSDEHNLIIIIGSVVGGLLVLIVVISIICWFNKNKKDGVGNGDSDSGNSEPDSPDDPNENDD